MDKVTECQQRAAECRALAQNAPNNEIRSHYEQLAEVWDQLAAEQQTGGKKDQ